MCDCNYMYAAMFCHKLSQGMWLYTNIIKINPNLLGHTFLTAKLSENFGIPSAPSGHCRSSSFSWHKPFPHTLKMRTRQRPIGTSMGVYLYTFQAPTLSVWLPAFSFEVHLGEEAIRPLAQQFVVAVFEFPRLWPASQAWTSECSARANTRKATNLILEAHTNMCKYIFQLICSK